MNFAKKKDRKESKDRTVKKRFKPRFGFGRKTHPVETLSISFDDEEYSPGDLVTGNVITNYFRAEKVREMSMRSIGKGIVAWTEKVRFDERQYHTQKTQLNSNEEIYFDFDSDLIDLDDDDWTIIPAGDQWFPFEFQLPYDIPSSYQELEATIQYTCIVVVKKLDKPKQKVIQTFKVVNRASNFKSIPGLFDPAEISDHKTLKTFCCTKGREIRFLLRVNQIGFIPGEKVNFHIELYNLSARHIFRSKIRLVKDIIYTANKRRRTYTFPILSKKLPGIKFGQDKAEIHDWIRLPRDRPVNLTGCDIIKIEFLLKFILQIPGASNLEGIIPIEISPDAPSPSISESEFDATGQQSPEGGDLDDQEETTIKTVNYSGTDKTETSPETQLGAPDSINSSKSPNPGNQISQLQVADTKGSTPIKSVAKKKK